MVVSNTLYQGQYYALCTNQDGEEFVSGSNEALVVALTSIGTLSVDEDYFVYADLMLSSY